MKDEIEFHQEEKEWRGYFARDLIASAEKFVKNGRIISFSCDEREARAELETRPGAAFRVRVGPAPQSYYEEWDPDGFSCDCFSKRGVTRDGRSTGSATMRRRRFWNGNRGMGRGNFPSRRRYRRRERARSRKKKNARRRPSAPRRNRSG